MRRLNGLIAIVLFWAAGHSQCPRVCIKERRELITPCLVRRRTRAWSFAGPASSRNAVIIDTIWHTSKLLDTALTVLLRQLKSQLKIYYTLPLPTPSRSTVLRWHVPNVLGCFNRPPCLNIHIEGHSDWRKAWWCHDIFVFFSSVHYRTHWTRIMDLLSGNHANIYKQVTESASLHVNFRCN